MPEAEASAAELGLPDIKALLAAFDASGATSFKLKRGDFKLELSKGAVAPPSPVAVPVVQAAPAAAGAVAPAAAPAAAPVVAAAPAMSVKSPMVGTFYRSPSPEASPFISVGDVVKPGQTVCIVEAMKLMNEIEVEQAGRVVRILVENGQAVEFGQVLIELEPV
ncbi:MAG: acetyl-CoA carboxylase biotin carboxyl carrier protein [Candidatus Sericytochromatia bacterium]|nr:acetyl-CoA carboxylase biotin carboxyl carrier protein [Candidatus Sericytochromatia bacterium]